ncbi:response regulator transcription factor [Nocardioides coralli]|uniref:response regulator transcription factor n=1 Tax=Nocardioides coralli TaxID=2872154 RepID=UPI001CA44C66|nr:LuxR C-terminal-related transcriptional regulator [Nocardioides coralli]QZY28826.1 LuxR C-terminal-related transcriptional regulator [Nocardioides coralli]
MRSARARYDEWLDLLADLTRHHNGPFPRAIIAEQLFDTFDCNISWNWMDEGGRFGWETSGPLPGFATTADDGAWMADALLKHPLVCWFTRTGDATAMTNGRVPRDLVPPDGFALVQEVLEPYGFEQQLSMPYVLAPGRYRTFVMARSSDDFTDEELELARRIQTLLAVLERQTELLEGQPPHLQGVGLTAREVAVLALLQEGLTAVAIGHRMQLSPRTVHAHLRSIYRKLGVGDRMRAVLAAQELGVLATGRAGGADLDAVPLEFRWTSPTPARLYDESPRTA